MDELFLLLNLNLNLVFSAINLWTIYQLKIMILYKYLFV
jgi:hypothetical protein